MNADNLARLEFFIALNQRLKTPAVRRARGGHNAPLFHELVYAQQLDASVDILRTGA